NPLKAGIVASDAMVAVSPTYSRQIQVDQGFGLEGVLREPVPFLHGGTPATARDAMVRAFQSEGDAKRWWPAISAIAADHGEILTACMERFYQAFGTAPLLSSIRGDARLRAIFESISDRIGGDL
ncbi:MAG: glycogen/starch synthase, partial [Myxococcales bacterium]|nr:glycogen/starch synthase [Myxococcales bacterium]